MIKALTITFVALLACVLVLGALIVAVRAVRLVTSRRQAALAAAPRRALLAFVAEGGEEGADELVAIPEPAWRAAEHTAVALLGKIRGEAQRALIAVFEQRGIAQSALVDLRARGAVRRARAAEALGNLGRRDAVPGLCALLDDPDAEVRVVAVRALGRIGAAAAAGPLLAALAGGRELP
ncbi:MAG TPA: HEAT repeat domain-containing protein, partial [Pilimelia sp.]|nr:HEAT repeat domain-containing protein [Pilimelia sp.]